MDEIFLSFLKAVLRDVQIFHAQAGKIADGDAIAIPIDLGYEEIAQIEGPVVLCGHSYGGMVIGGVADKIPERIRNLVFIDAVVPENGKCMNDYVFPAGS